jgi:hypothetical protein
MEEPDGSSIVGAVISAGEALDNHDVPRNGRTLFIMSKYYTMLKSSSEFMGLEKLGERALAQGIVGEIDGARVVPVASSRMPQNCFFILTHRDSTTSPVKLDEYKVHENPPGISGALVEGRLYFDAFVINAKKNGVYAAVDADSAVARPVADPAGGTEIIPGTTTIAISCATEGAEIYYTKDGSDPRFSDTRELYEAPISTAGMAVSMNIRAYAADGEKYDSELLVADYTA